MQSSGKKQASTFLVIVLSVLALMWYGSFLYSGKYIGSPVAYSILLIAEVFAMFELLGMWLTLIVGREGIPESGQAERMRQALKRLKPGEVPDNLVAVFVTVAGEPIGTIRKTVTAARDMLVRHRTVILDDGSSDNVRILAQELGVEYLRRDNNVGKKAGNINNALTQIHTEYVAVFDSDQVPNPHFLLKTLPAMLADDQIAFVQTPQFFGNREGFVSGGAAEIQEVFYRHVQSAKNVFNAAFCVGTNVLFRRNALNTVGGIYSKSNSEDIWTSILIHERGWKSYFVEDVLAIGHAPETVGDFLAQQFRWARGGLEILFRHNPLFRSTLTFDQRWQYLHTTMHYLSGVSVLLFYILPILFAFFGMMPLQTDVPFLWFTRFVPYLGMIFLSTRHLLGRWPKWRSYVMAMGVFPAHLAALFSVLTGVKARWSVTGVIKNRTDYVTAVFPQMLILTLSLCAVPLAFLQEGNTVLHVMVAGWLTFNSLILFSFCKHAFPQYVRLPNGRQVLPNGRQVMPSHSYAHS